MSTKRILDKAIKMIDFAGFVLKKKNGYELGVNSYHKLYIAFPGESMNNPHMLLGEDNTSNRTKAEKMFEEFANLKSKSKDATVKITYEDAVGDSHTFIKSSVEEAKKWIDEGRFPHGKAFNIKINGQLYKKQVMGR